MVKYIVLDFGMVLAHILQLEIGTFYINTNSNKNPPIP